MNGILELAKILKDRENQLYEGYVIGEVVDDFPDIKIRLGENIHLDASHLVFAAHLLNGYTREYELNNINPVMNLKGQITFTNTIKEGEKVILVPSQNSQSYIVIDKAVTFNVSGR